MKNKIGFVFTVIVMGLFIASCEKNINHNGIKQNIEADTVKLTELEDSIMKKYRGEPKLIPPVREKPPVNADRKLQLMDSVLRAIAAEMESDSVMEPRYQDPILQARLKAADSAKRAQQTNPSIE